MTNPQKTNVKIAGGVTVLGLGLIFLPGWIDLPGMHGGYALSFIGIVTALSGVVITLFFQQRAAQMDRLLAGTELLAHWTYQATEWQRFADLEFREKTVENKGMLKVITVWAVIIGGIFCLIDRKDGWFVLVLMLGFVLLLTGVAYGLPRIRRWRHGRGPNEAFITSSSFYFDHIFISWKTWGTRLEKVAWRPSKKEAPALLIFFVSAPTKSGRQTQTFRLPVPHGREDEGKSLLNHFS